MTGLAIHIVDDDAPFRDSLGFVLSAHGYDVATYGDPADFLRRFVDDRLACIICDIRMSGMSGIEVARTLRKRGIGASIILVTGHADPALVEHALQAGAALVLEKPFPPQRLIAALNALSSPDQETLHRLET